MLCRSRDTIDRDRVVAFGRASRMAGVSSSARYLRHYDEQQQSSEDQLWQSSIPGFPPPGSRGEH